jgi:acylphosphatase
MPVCRQIFVSGRVQGVFFRDSTRQVANELGLSGGVRNLYDGRVEVQVCGDPGPVHRLMKWLENGPKMAKVSTIDSTDIVVSDGDMIKQANGRFTIWPDA